MNSNSRKTLSLLLSLLIISSCTTTPKTLKGNNNVVDSRRVIIGDRIRTNGIKDDDFEDEDTDKRESKKIQKRNGLRQFPTNNPIDKKAQPDRESARELLKALSLLQ